MMRFLFLLSLLTTVSSVHVLVADASGNPLPGLQVKLVLYDFENRDGQIEVRKTFSDRCTTDQNGECTIMIGETDGVLRGRLDLGRYGGRDVIWLGGVLNAPVLIDLGSHWVKGTEAGPYDFLQKDEGVSIQQGPPWIAILIVGMMLGGIVYWAYIRSMKEHS